MWTSISPIFGNQPGLEVSRILPIPFIWMMLPLIPFLLVEAMQWLSEMRMQDQ